MGSLIAIMLGRLKMSVKDCIKEYEKLSQDVFGTSRSSISWTGQVQGKYKSEALERAIKGVIVDAGLDVNELMWEDADNSCKV